MENNKKFVAEMLTKYSKHLSSVVESIERNIADYDRQISSLQLLDQRKYGWRLREMEDKKVEAFIKLAQVTPNIEKMQEIIKEIYNISE